MDVAKAGWAGILGGAALGAICAGGAVFLFTATRSAPSAERAPGRPNSLTSSSRDENQQLRAALHTLRYGASSADPSVAERIARLEKQLQHLESQTAAVLPLDLPSEEEGRKVFQHKLEQHRADPADPEWAPSSTSQLMDSLSTLQADFGGYKPVAATCRTSTCEVTVEWPSTEAALAGQKLAARVPLATNCSRELLLEKELTKEGTQRATMLLDCTQWRADGSKPFKWAPPAPIAGKEPASP